MVRRLALVACLLSGLGVLLVVLAGCGEDNPARTTRLPVSVPPTGTPIPDGPACLPYGRVVRDTPSPAPTYERPPWVTALPVTVTPTWDPQTPSPTPSPMPTPIPPTCSPRPDQPALTPTPTAGPTAAPALTAVPPFPGGGSSPQNLSNSLGFDYVGEMALDSSGRGHAVYGWWTEDFWNQAKSYYVGQDAAGGWTHRTVLAQEVAKSKGSPSLAVGPGDVLYAAYGDGLGKEVAVFLKVSTDGGTTWSAPEQLTAKGSAYPTVRVDDSGLVHVLYRRMQCEGDPDDEATVCHSFQEYTEGRPGGPWSDPVRPLGSSPEQIHAGMTCVQTPGGVTRTFVVIARQYDGVYVTYKEGAGWSFPVKVRNTPGKSAQSIRPIGFVHGGALFIYVFWEQYAVSGIESAFSADGGGSWQYQEVTTLGAEEGLYIGAPAPFYDYLNGKIWVVYTHVTMSPRRGFIGVVGATPGEGNWWPSVPSSDELVVLEADNKQAHDVRVGWRNGALAVPVLWCEHIRPPYGAYDLEVYEAWINLAFLGNLLP